LLVAVDDSVPSQFAIGEALRIARRSPRPVIFAVMLDPAILSQNYGLASEQQLAESLAGDLVYWATQRAREAGVSASSKTLFSDVPQGIIDLATGEKASMIVMGTHGRSGLTRALLRSVAEAAIRRTDTPVVIMRAPPSQQICGRFLVPIAKNELEQAAGRYAVTLAHEFESMLLFCTVHSEAGDDQALLDRAKQFAIDNGVKADVLPLEGENVAKSLLEFAGTQQIDAIVMATHGREGFMRMVEGSVTESVIRATMYPVAVIRPH
jgi:nucleotide-binding universal stress UspA family protein